MLEIALVLRSVRRVRDGRRGDQGLGETMGLGWSKVKASPIAVDLGADSLKLLQIMPSDPPQVLAAVAAVVPEHARCDPVARQQFILEAMHTMLKDQPFKGKRVICSIPSCQTMVTHLQLPRNDQDSLKDQIAFHLRQRFNVDPSRMIIRHIHVGQFIRDGSPKEEVICMSVGREAVLRHINTLRGLKLDVVGLHCEPFAVMQAFSHLYRRKNDDDRTTCYVDIGGTTTKVIIAHGRKIAFAKVIHAAGDHLTRHLAQRQGISFMEAREARIDGMEVNAANLRNEQAEAPASAAGASQAEPATDQNTTSDTATITTEQPTIRTDKYQGSNRRVAATPEVLATAVSDKRDGHSHEIECDTLDCMIDELQMSVRYHHGMYPDRPIEKLVFFGGESRQVATCQKVAEGLQIGAQLGDPLARIDRAALQASQSGLDLTTPQPGWAVPLGLCLCEANL